MAISEKQNRIKAINELLNKKINSRSELMALKRKLSKKYGLALLANSEILNEYKNLVDRKNINRLPLLERILRKRTVRTQSGIAPVAVLTKSYPCPGECVYCPKERNVPQSYLSNEPAVMRAIHCRFDPYKQVQYRLEALEANGHEPTKIELIVIGGTWSVLPEKYKYWYIKECFRAANEYGKRISNFEFRISNQFLNHKLEIKNYKFNQNLKFKIQKLKHQLLVEQKKNEKAKYKIIGITLETRPDYIDAQELLEMRELGATRVELGVQAIDDQILKLNKRGHGISKIIQATKLLKDYGFKVTYHIMPGLPGSTAKKDLAMFKKLFTDSRFQPDQIKFYPTVVARGSLLYQWWRDGKYKPYSDKVLQGLIVACKKVVPPYVRIIRLIRDIPAESIIAGNKITNLRQVMKGQGVKCRCIRCREVKERESGIRNQELGIIKYQASSGVEYFIQATDKKNDMLYGFCRLRLPPRNPQLVTHNLMKDAAMVRELHVYGELVPVGGRKKVQHAGLGKRLMKEAEKIARKKGFKKIAVIAGVGVRDYYRKLGYKLWHSYMIKNLL